MEWQYIIYFLKVAELEHVTKAAQELNITQPALSRAIKRLEEELGVPLFTRDKKSITLNRYGLMFRERALRIETEMNVAQKEIQERLNPEYGEISIGFFHTLGIDKLPKLLASFKQKFPKVTFNLKQANKTRLLEMLYNDQIDFCFTTITGGEQRGNYVMYELWEEKLYLSVAKENRLAEKKTIEWEDLINENFVILKEGYGLREISDKIFEQLPFTPTYSFEGDEIDTIAGLVSANLGIALLPKLQGNQNVKQIEIASQECKRTIGVIWNGNALIAPISKKFLEHVTGHFFNGDLMKNIEKT